MWEAPPSLSFSRHLTIARAPPRHQAHNATTTRAEPPDLGSPAAAEEVVAVRSWEREGEEEKKKRPPPITVTVAHRCRSHRHRPRTAVRATAAAYGEGGGDDAGGWI